MDGLTFAIYDKTNTYQCEVAATIEAHALDARNVIPTATFTVDDDYRDLGLIGAPGARAGVWFRGLEMFRGRIGTITGKGPKGACTVPIAGDLRKMWQWEAWPSPALPKTSQADQIVYSGTSEHILKQAARDNIARLGAGWTVAADHIAGTPLTSGTFRFDPIADIAIPLIEADGLVAYVRYDTSGNPILDVRQPNTLLGTLTPESGLIDFYEFSLAPETGSRATIGGYGTGSARDIEVVVDAALELAVNDITEVFADSGSSESGADLVKPGETALADAAPQNGLALTLADSGMLDFLTTYKTGDLVPTAVGQVNATLPFMSVQIDQTREEGLKVVPSLGQVTVNPDSDQVLARAFARLAAGLRKAGRR